MGPATSCHHDRFSYPGTPIQDQNHWFSSFLVWDAFNISSLRSLADFCIVYLSIIFVLPIVFIFFVIDYDLFCEFYGYSRVFSVRPRPTRHPMNPRLSSEDLDQTSCPHKEYKVLSPSRLQSLGTTLIYVRSAECQFHLHLSFLLWILWRTPGGFVQLALRQDLIAWFGMKWNLWKSR